MPDTQFEIRPGRQSERHELNAFARTAGLLWLAFCALTLASRADLFQVDGLVVLASVWVVLGVVGVSRAVYRLTHRDTPRSGLIGRQQSG